MPSKVVKFVATPILGSGLEPGDLFSTAGPEYWEAVDEMKSCGEKVYIRTNTPAEEFMDSYTIVYRITLEYTPDLTQNFYKPPFEYNTPLGTIKVDRPKKTED